MLPPMAGRWSVVESLSDEEITVMVRPRQQALCRFSARSYVKSGKVVKQPSPLLAASMEGQSRTTALGISSDSMVGVLYGRRLEMGPSPGWSCFLLILKPPSVFLDYSLSQR